jgi:hypothetical protein
MKTTCQEVVFAGGTCRLDISDETRDPDMPAYAVQMRLMDPDRATSHDLVLRDGSRAEVHGQSEAIALSSAIAFLEQRLGALSEYAHGCLDATDKTIAGDPIVIDAS